MDSKQFRKYAHEMVDWMADYLENIEEMPVRSEKKPGDIIAALPKSPPQQSESMDSIFADFNSLIIPGMTHWQHPSFFAYFPANSSYPSVLAEMLTATMGAQCMIWQTSPAAAELEERMMEWIADMQQLPAGFTGVIQDTASTATLCAILTAREKVSEYDVNKSGFTGQKFVVYCSDQTHSSIDKAVRIAGIGSSNLRKIPVDDSFALRPAVLAESIAQDRKDGLTPLCVVAACGTTGSTAIDPLEQIGEICRNENIWLHVDAAYAGTAAMLPEKRWILNGVEHADSYVFNPHKWMFTNFDCTAYYVKDKSALIRTFEILPEYLKTREDSQVNNYRDWGVPLGRRFRALKLWFVIRSFGVEGLRSKLRKHIELAEMFRNRVDEHPDFQLLAPVPLNTVCFHYAPHGSSIEEQNRWNAALLEELNSTGQMYLTHTKLDGVYTIRMVIGQTNVELKHIEQAWQQIQRLAERV